MQGGQKKETYRRMYDDAMDGVADVLVQKVTCTIYHSNRGINNVSAKHQI